VPDSIRKKLGVKLHLRRHHPLQILKSRLEKYWTSYRCVFDNLQLKDEMANKHLDYDLLTRCQRPRERRKRGLQVVRRLARRGFHGTQLRFSPHPERSCFPSPGRYLLYHDTVSSAELFPSLHFFFLRNCVLSACIFPSSLLFLALSLSLSLC
jgi:hypothetical protein